MKKTIKKFFGRQLVNVVTRVKNIYIRDAMNIYFKGDASIQQAIPNIEYLYQACIHAQIQFLRYNILNKEIHFKTKEGIHLVTNKDFLVFVETFCFQNYGGFLDYLKEEKYVVFDIGANRGYTTLDFAKSEACQHVFSFEPDPNTFEYIQKNRSYNPKLAPKIEAFQYGLSDKTQTLTFFQPNDGSDWTTTSNIEFGNSYWSDERKNNVKKTELEVRCASEEIKRIADSYQLGNIQKIMKIDIEGAEYEVLTDLEKNGVLESFSLIFGECHLGYEDIEKITKEHFDLIHLEKGPIKGLYNFILLNKTQGA